MVPAQILILNLAKCWGCRSKIQQIEIGSPSVEPKIKTIRSKCRYLSNPYFFAIFGVSFYNLIIKAMAKVTFTPSIEAIGGKIGNFVYAQNRAGAYIRKRVVPNNPKTIYQDEARALLTRSSKAWGGLTGAQRTQWITTAGNRIYKGKGLGAGTSSIPSGKALFQECFMNAVLTGESPLDSPGQHTQSFDATPTSLTIDKTNDKVLLKVDKQPTRGVNIYCSVTPELSAGTSFYGTKYKGIGGMQIIALATEFEFTTEYTARFGATLPTAGNRSCLVRLIDSSFYTGLSLVIPVLYS